MAAAKAPVRGNISNIIASNRTRLGIDSTGSYAGALNSAADAIDTFSSIADANSARSANEARIQREWQEVQNAKAMQFSAQQAALNRDWQKMMSDTAHQREIADLKAAGLNPVLSAMGGNGAAVTSGATASGVTSAGAKGEVDMSMNSALVSLLAAVYNRTTQIEAANINARTQEAVADKYNATSEIVAQIGAAASRYSSDSSRSASQYSSDNAYLAALNAAASALEGTKYSSNSAKSASQYSTDKNVEQSDKNSKRSFWSNLISGGLSAVSNFLPVVGAGRRVIGFK